MRQVNTYWRECPGVAEVKRNIEDAKKDLAKVQKQIDDLVEKVRTALGNRYLYEAQRLILSLRDISQAKGYLVSEEKDVEKHLADVRTKLAQLLAITDITKKIDICEEIIAVAADCREAQDALAKYPPLPPSNLSAKVNTAGSVDLT
jgi:chromosome segregation ATPase